MDKYYILQKIKENDKEAIADFYKSCRNDFIAFAMNKFSISFNMSKEIFQDAFLAMYRNICRGKLKELKSSLKTYLFQIGKNLINNELKREARLTELTSQKGLQDYEPESFDAESNNEKEQLIKKVIKQAMQNLNEKCRKLLKLFYYEQKKYDEIMLIMNYTTVDSLKTQKYKCFKKLEMVVKSQYDKSDFFK